MKLHRINAIVLHYWYHSKRSLPRIMDIFYWPTVDLILWGLISIFLQKSELTGFNAVSILVGAVILWTIFRRSQQDITISFLEDVWHRNVINLFIAPLKISEYLIGGIIVAVVKIGIILSYMSILASILYHFNVFTIGIALVPFIALLSLFGWAVGIFISAIIFRFGTESQILAFALAFLLQPISAVFYPLSILPSFAQKIAWLLPTTHIFEGMRQALNGFGLSITHLSWALGLSIAYLILASLFYKYMFNRVRKLGLISKLE